MQTQMLTLLKLALYAFNEIPNKRIDHKEFRNTYELASRIGKLINDMEGLNTVLPTFSPESVPAQWDNVEIEPVVYLPLQKSYEVADITDHNHPPTHWSVYLHDVEGGVQCIADVETEQQANTLHDLLTKAVKQFKDNGHLK
jgi:hypothetical protein